MKRISLLKNSIILSGVAAAITPAIILTTTSCKINSFMCDTYTFADLQKAINNKNATLGSFSHESKTSFKHLLYGDKHLYGGNYILFFGSNTVNETSNFFAGDPLIRSRKEWFDSDKYFFDSALCAAAIKATSEKPHVDFGFYNLIDFFDPDEFKYTDKKGHVIEIAQKTGSSDPDVMQNISPRAQWTASIIEATYQYNRDAEGIRYEWDKESVEEGDYIRNDASAKAYREFMDFGSRLYPKKEKSNDGEEGREFTFSDFDSSVAIFKEGKLVELKRIYANGDDLGIDIDKYFIQSEEE